MLEFALLAAAVPMTNPPPLQEANPPLDPRISSERITETDPPPLPQTVLLPLPSDQRIAERAEQVPIERAQWDAAIAAIESGLRALAKRQDDSGGWMIDAQAAPTGAADQPAPVAVAVTALATKARLQYHGSIEDGPSVDAAFAFMQRARNDDGSFEGGPLTNYVTSTVASALASMQTTTARRHLELTVNWLEGGQWDEGEGLTKRQDWYGGAGYGRHGRPDLSNTQMMLEAMYDAGRSPDEPAFQRAVAFISRAQNHTATNPSAWSGNDGGFVYTPANGGESMASEAAGEGRRGELIAEGAPHGLRSYGSMTYAGFKSLLYAGLSPDDPRVRAAFAWICAHWTFDENPGMGQQGLYYYYHAMSRALRVSQQHTLVSHDGATHNWREELITAITRRQRDDGTWINAADRWLEGEADLATAYAILALEEALKPVTFE